MQDKRVATGQFGKNLRRCRGAALAGRLLHPLQIQIIDALRRADRPLTAGELFDACDGEPEWLRFVRLLRQLGNLGAVEPVRLPPNSSPFDMRYRLAALRERGNRGRESR